MTIESDVPDPYEVLGVRTDATDDQVRKAWRKKTKTTGPGTAEFAAFNDAAELLLDRVRRSAYDADVATKRAAAEREAAEQAGAAIGASDPKTEAPPVVAEPGGVQPSRLRRLTAGWNGTVLIAGVIAVLALALALWQGISAATHHSPSAGPGTGGVAAGNFAEPASVQTAVLSTVQTGLPAVLGYSYNSMPQDLKNAQRFLSSRLASNLSANYRRLIAGGTPPGCKRALAPIASTKTVVTATVVSLGVVSVGASSAQVGAFVNQTTTTATQAAKTTQNRVLVSLVKQGNTWLIDSMSVPNTDGILNC